MKDILADLETTKLNKLDTHVNLPTMASMSLVDDIRKHLRLQDTPNVEIDTFSGNPTDFHYFMCTFKEVVENKIDDSLGRLTRLIKYTTGEAKELIKHCIQEDPDAGYTHAKRLLKEQYGNPHRIASAYVKELRTWPILKDGNSFAFRKLHRFLIKCQAL